LRKINNPVAGMQPLPHLIFFYSGDIKFVLWQFR